MHSEPPVVHLTATRRLARHLASRERQQQERAGERVWSPSRTLQVGDWLRWLWEQSWPSEVLLTPVQEELLWEEQIRAHAGRGRSEAQVADGALVSEALAAQRLLGDWLIDLPDDEAKGTEARAFLNWRRGVQGRHRDERFRDPAGLQSWALSALRERQVPVPTEVLLHGFDQATPFLLQLRRVLEGVGSRVSFAQRPAVPGKLQLFRAADEWEEIQQAACWARDQVLSGGRSIGVIVPQLAAKREDVERAFADELTPAAVLRSDVQPTEARHNISLGPLLGDWPLVVTAVTIWNATPELTLEEAIHLLRSPYFAALEAEWQARARLEVEVRRRRSVRLTWGSLKELADEHGAPIWGRGLERLQIALGNEPKSCAPTEWPRVVQGLLTAAGWPGDRGLDSVEQQTKQRLLDWISDLGQLQLVVTQLSKQEWRARFERAGRTLRFQPQGVDAPVQILGALEAGGLEFEQVWLLGLHDEGWPPRGAPNFLLPLGWQRTQDMPHASPARELDFARQMTGRLLRAAPRVVASYPAHGDEREFRPSPLLGDLSHVEQEDPRKSVAVIRAPEGRGHGVEALRDDPAPPAPAAALRRGGVSLFADQAACPFRAFAVHRLRARPLEVPDESIDPRERGELLHTALEQFWREWRDHETLTRKSVEERLAAIQRFVEAAATEFLDQRHDLLPVYRELERRRAQEILAQWLEGEAGRPPFRVESLEERLVLECGGVSVSARLDRLDRLEDGSALIIDYKAGRSPSPSSWSGGRPDAPQLPLYAVGSGLANVSGLVFGSLTRDRTSFVGCTRDAATLPGVRGVPSESGAAAAKAWQEMLDEWQRVLERLGREFLAGRAEVEPKHVRRTCERCDQQALCRIADRRWLDDGEEARSQEPPPDFEEERIRT